MEALAPRRLERRYSL